MRYQGEAETNPEIEARWHTVGFQHKDAYPLEVLAQLLNGRTGRLYKAMVLPQDAMATQASAAQQTQKYAGAFSIGAEVKDGKTPADVEGKLLAEVEKLQKELVPLEELQKVKNNFAAAAFRRLSSNFPIAVQLLRSDGFGDWREMNDGPKRIQAVTAEDVRRVAQKYFTKENRAIAVYTRKAGEPAPEPDDPSIANLPAETRNRIKATVAQIKVSTNLDRLQGMVQQTEAALGSAPVGAKAGIEVVLKAAKARIEELKKK
jgi:predicted Zn-dependent peptidase